MSKTFPPLPEIVDSVATTELTTSKTFTADKYTPVFSLSDVQYVVGDFMRRYNLASGYRINLVNAFKRHMKHQAKTILREKHRWIPIAEGLPERERYCLIRYKGMCAMHYKAVWLMDATLWTDSQGNVYPVQPTDEWRYITTPDTSQPIENQGIWSYNLAKKVKGE